MVFFLELGVSQRIIKVIGLTSDLIHKRPVHFTIFLTHSAWMRKCLFHSRGYMFSSISGCCVFFVFISLDNNLMSAHKSDHREQHSNGAYNNPKAEKEPNISSLVRMAYTIRASSFFSTHNLALTNALTQNSHKFDLGFKKAESNRSWNICGHIKKWNEIENSNNSH